MMEAVMYEGSRWKLLCMRVQEEISKDIHLCLIFEDESAYNAVNRNLIFYFFLFNMELLVSIFIMTMVE